MLSAALTLLFFGYTDSWKCDCQCVDKSVPVICKELKKISCHDMKVNISIECEYNGWIKFEANSDGNRGYGYVYQNKLVTFGSAISDEEMDEFNIPFGVR